MPVQHHVEEMAQKALNMFFKEHHQTPAEPLVLNQYLFIRGTFQATFSSASFPGELVEVVIDGQTGQTFAYLFKSIDRDVFRDQPTLFPVKD